MRLIRESREREVSEEAEESRRAVYALERIESEARESGVVIEWGRRMREMVSAREGESVDTVVVSAEGSLGDAGAGTLFCLEAVMRPMQRNMAM